MADIFPPLVVHDRDQRRIYLLLTKKPDGKWHLSDRDGDGNLHTGHNTDYIFSATTSKAEYVDAVKRARFTNVHVDADRGYKSEVIGDGSSIALRVNVYGDDGRVINAYRIPYTVVVEIDGEEVLYDPGNGNGGGSLP